MATGDLAATPRTLRGKPFLMILRRVMSHLPGYRGITAVLVAVGTLAALAESIGITLVVLFVYASLGQLETGVQAVGPLGSMFQSLSGTTQLGKGLLIGAIICAIVFKSLFSVFNAVLGSRIRHRILYLVRSRLFHAILEKPYLELSWHDRGDLLTLVATELYALAKAHDRIVRIGVNIGSIGIFGLSLAATSWKVAFIAALGGLLHAQVMRLFSGVVRRLGAQAVEANQALNGAVYSMLQGMRTVRAFGRERVQERRFDRLLKEELSVSERAEAIGYLGQPISEILTLGLLTVVLGVSSTLGIPLASVLTSLVLIYRLQPHLRELDASRLDLDAMQASLDAIERFGWKDPLLALPDGIRPFEHLKDQISYRDVSMSYPGFTQPSLEGASFNVPAGKRTAILGPSGAGKSTIVALLLRLFQPTAGTILVDGVPLKDIRREVLAGACCGRGPGRGIGGGLYPREHHLRA